MKAIREISKVILFTVVWATPFIMAHLHGAWYLLLIFISIFASFLVFGHYEDLEIIDGTNKLVDPKENERK
jgi:hypothetical protein